MTTTRTTDTLWVCVDCFYAANGLEDESGHTPDRDPLGLVDAGATVVPGGPHESDCPNIGPAGEWIGESDCDCERITFSWTPCGGCGSTLGGAREAVTVRED